MTLYWFPDNTVLCNFAAANGLPLLRQVLDGRGRWVEAIAAEAAKSASVHPDLASIERDGWLGEPIEITDPSEILRIDQVRRAALGGRPEQPMKHLGEAQTCHVILHWSEFEGSWWLTDDRDARDYGRFCGITTRDTMDLVSEAVQCGYVTRERGFALLLRMVDEGRHLRIPSHPSDL